MTAAAVVTPAAQPAGDLILDAKGVTKRFGGLIAVSDIDFQIPRGAIVSLIGPNGAGKTTFFNMITGLYTPSEGEIWFNGRNITRFKPHQVVRTGIGRTFQNIRLFGNMTALDNVLVGLHHTLKGHWWEAIVHGPGIMNEEARALARARELLALMNLSARESDYARNLPYGDQRRLEIARALATDCKLLLLDEPTAGMNPNETLELTQFVRRIRDQLGLTVLLIEHDMKVVMGPGTSGSMLDPSVPLEERDSVKYGHGKWTRVLLDATINWELEPQEQYGGNRYPPIGTAISDKMAATVKRRWREYGF